MLIGWLQRVPKFWLLQILGWSAYAGLDFVLVTSLLKDLPVFKDQRAEVIAHCIFIGSLFVASLALRLIYRPVLRRSMPWTNAPSPRTMLQAMVLAGLMGLVCCTLAEGVWIGLKGTWGGWWWFVRRVWLDAVYGPILLMAWSALYLGIKHYQAFQAEHERAVNAEALAREARLEALRYQLNPHFLFNTLNAISTLVVKEESKAANRMLVQLAGFLRSTLDGLGVHEIPLSREISSTEQYLEIEKSRLGNRLELEFSVAPEANGSLVPPLLLQPLVENAIRHGIAPNAEGGKLTIKVDRIVDRIRLVISDNGVGARSRDRKPAMQRRGVGLSNTIERLRVFYGPDHRLVVQWPPEGGCRIEIELPYKVAPRSDWRMEKQCACSNRR